MPLNDAQKKELEELRLLEALENKFGKNPEQAKWLEIMRAGETPKELGVGRAELELANQVAQGATLGLSKPIKSHGMALARLLTGQGETPSVMGANNAYTATLEDELAKEAQFKKEAPNISLAANLAGGFYRGGPSDKIFGSIANKAKQLLPNGASQVGNFLKDTARGLGTGAVGGVTANTLANVSNMASGEGLKNPLEGTATAAAIGGGIGAGLPALIGAGAKGKELLKKTGRWVGEKWTGMGERQAEIYRKNPEAIHEMYEKMTGSANQRPRRDEVMNWMNQLGETELNNIENIISDLDKQQQRLLTGNKTVSYKVANLQPTGSPSVDAHRARLLARRDLGGPKTAQKTEIEPNPEYEKWLQQKQFIEEQNQRMFNNRKQYYSSKGEIPPVEVTQPRENIHVTKELEVTPDYIRSKQELPNYEPTGPFRGSDVIRKEQYGEVVPNPNYQDELVLKQMDELNNKGISEVNRLSNDIPYDLPKAPLPFLKGKTVNVEYGNTPPSDYIKATAKELHDLNLLERNANDFFEVNPITGQKATTRSDLARDSVESRKATLGALSDEQPLLSTTGFAGRESPRQRYQDIMKSKEELYNTKNALKDLFNAQTAKKMVTKGVDAGSQFDELITNLDEIAKSKTSPELENAAQQLSAALKMGSGPNSASVYKGPVGRFILRNLVRELPKAPTYSDDYSRNLKLLGPLFNRPSSEE